MAEKELMIIFGTETGNAEMLAEDAQRMAPNYGLNATIHDMDDLSLDDFDGVTRLLVTCSTWGDGDQPMNAEDLYESMEGASDGAMNGVNFAVLALGDTSYEMFCESGKQWDAVLEEKGGNRIKERIDLDTDFEDFSEEWLQSALEAFQIV
ncbi:MAG: flavodoxin domain-containing protein [Candidatus Thermoplasmatota archaeon]|nr:flavodoxin domain-containing protein [Candidatus Thermoplasmatota archaeon]